VLGLEKALRALPRDLVDGVDEEDPAALPERRPASSLWICQSASRRATLGAARQPRRLSKNTASPGGLSTYPLVVSSLRRWLRAEMTLLTGTGGECRWNYMDVPVPGSTPGGWMLHPAVAQEIE
jgi:hypothetical protein